MSVCIKPYLSYRLLWYIYMDMINLPRILNSRYVRDAVPSIVHNTTPHTVSFKDTKTIARKIFNQMSVVEEQDVDIGTRDMCCDCNTSKYCYTPVGHVVTGDLGILKDAKLRRKRTIM